MINVVKKVFWVSLLACLILNGTNVMAAINSEQKEDINGVVTPFSSYLASGTITFQATADTQRVIVTTRAFLKVQNIYHHIKVYKISGGVQSLIHDNTYYDYDITLLTTNLPFSAKSGDQFIVQVDHYTYHNGLLETIHTEKSTIF